MFRSSFFPSLDATHQQISSGFSLLLVLVTGLCMVSVKSNKVCAVGGGRERLRPFSGWSYAVPCIASLQSTWQAKYKSGRACKCDAFHGMALIKTCHYIEETCKQGNCSEHGNQAVL